MKIMIVIHGFLPYNMAGSEVYTYNLARKLAKEDEVYVFHRIDDQNLKEYEIISNTFHGLKVYCINNTFRYSGSFDGTYKNDTIAEKFGKLLDDIRPDIVHFGHVGTLSITLVRESKKRNIPVVFTLHDFWLMCHLGQLLKWDLVPCDGPEVSECSRCLAPKLAVNKGIRRTFEVMKRRIPNFEKKTKTRLLKIISTVYRQYAKAFVLLNRTGSEAHIEKRNGYIREMCSQVDLFIAPSQFLLEKFLEFGIPHHKIVYHDYGFNTVPFNNFSKVNSQKIRFGYTGTLIPSKGVHVLLEAFGSVKSQNAELRIHGKFVPHHYGFEDYPGYLKSLAKKDNVLWFGEYDNNNIARILSEIDILVVPSIWYENSPLVIHEAFMAGMPVIASNIGGMAELVHDGINGLLFQVGDREELARTMRMVIDEPGLIERLRKNIRPIIPIDRHTSEIQKIYRIVIDEKIK